LVVVVVVVVVAMVFALVMGVVTLKLVELWFSSCPNQKHQQS